MGILTSKNKPREQETSESVVADSDIAKCEKHGDDSFETKIQDDSSKDTQSRMVHDGVEETDINIINQTKQRTTETGRKNTTDKHGAELEGTKTLQDNAKSSSDMNAGNTIERENTTGSVQDEKTKLDTKGHQYLSNDTSQVTPDVASYAEPKGTAELTKQSRNTETDRNNTNDNHDEQASKTNEMKDTANSSSVTLAIPIEARAESRIGDETTNNAVQGGEVSDTKEYQHASNTSRIKPDGGGKSDISIQKSTFELTFERNKEKIIKSTTYKDDDESLRKETKQDNANSSSETRVCKNVERETTTDAIQDGELSDTKGHPHKSKSSLLTDGENGSDEKGKKEHISNCKSECPSTIKTSNEETYKICSSQKPSDVFSSVTIKTNSIYVSKVDTCPSIGTCTQSNMEQQGDGFSNKENMKDQITNPSVMSPESSELNDNNALSEIIIPDKGSQAIKMYASESISKSRQIIKEEFCILQEDNDFQDKYRKTKVKTFLCIKESVELESSLLERLKKRALKPLSAVCLVILSCAVTPKEHTDKEMLFGAVVKYKYSGDELEIRACSQNKQAREEVQTFLRKGHIQIFCCQQRGENYHQSEKPVLLENVVAHLKTRYSSTFLVYTVDDHCQVNSADPVVIMCVKRGRMVPDIQSIVDCLKPEMFGFYSVIYLRHREKHVSNRDLMYSKINDAFLKTFACIIQFVYAIKDLEIYECDVNVKAHAQFEKYLKKTVGL